MDFTDTHPKIENILIEGYRKMTPQQKMARIDELTRAIQELALSRIQKQYPNATEKEQQLRLASLWLDRETMLNLFDWDPQQKGY